MSSMSKEITVVVPTFNRRSMLQTAVDSVLNETRIPLKLHIFDNASDDGTAEYLAELAASDPRVVVTRNKENIGSTKNYINALASVKTAYFVPLADDDSLVAGFLYEAWNLLQSNPSAYAAAFFAEVRDESGKKQYLQPRRPEGSHTGLHSQSETLHDLMKWGHFCWSSILWRKETLDHIGYPYFHTGMSSDVDFQLQIFAKFPVVKSPNVGCIYNIHGSQAQLGYDVYSIPDWSKLISRLDAVAAPLFSAEKYAELRTAILGKYRKMWSRFPATPIDSAKIVPLAAISGARLGDWALAEQLLDCIEDDNSGRHESLLAVLTHEAAASSKRSLRHQQQAVSESARQAGEIKALQRLLDDVKEENARLTAGVLQKIRYQIRRFNRKRKAIRARRTG